MKPFSLGLLLIFTLLSTNCNTQVEEDLPKTKVYNHEEFVMGVDLSFVNGLEDNGAKYFDETGAKDPFKIMKESGANLVRVRLWHSPKWQENIYGSQKYSTLSDVEKTISRAKANGMAVNLDLHYSDNWADPAKQETPAAWQNLSLDILKDSVYQYTLKVLNHLNSKNLVPEYIQIGNETNGGVMFPRGQVINNQWNNFGQLLSAGLKAVKDFEASSGKDLKTILHVAQLQNADWWANGVINTAKVNDFDILGISHYFLWSNVHDMNTIRNNIADLSYKFKKKIMIVETAYPWTSASKDNYPNIISGNVGESGYAISAEEQKRYMEDLTEAIFLGGGSGIMYWEPAWISTNMKDQWGTGSSWENNAFFDFDGKLLPVVEFMTKNYGN